MIQSTCDVSNAGFAHAEAPPHPDRSGDASHRQCDPTSPRKRGEVTPHTALRRKKRANIFPMLREHEKLGRMKRLLRHAMFFPGQPCRKRGEVKSALAFIRNCPAASAARLRNATPALSA